MMSSPGMYKVLLVMDLRGRISLALVTLVVVAVVGARHSAVSVTTPPPGPTPARPRHVEGLLRRGVVAVVLYHGDTVFCAPVYFVTSTIGAVSFVTVTVYCRCSLFAI